jgi:hypothetical protein
MKYEIQLTVQVECTEGIREANKIADQMLTSLCVAPEYFKQLLGCEVAEVYALGEKEE